MYNNKGMCWRFLSYLLSSSMTWRKENMLPNRLPLFSSSVYFYIWTIAFDLRAIPKVTDKLSVDFNVSQILTMFTPLVDTSLICLQLQSQESGSELHITLCPRLCVDLRGLPQNCHLSVLPPFLLSSTALTWASLHPLPERASDFGEKLRSPLKYQI